jgi:serine/threonine-protein kinase
MADDRLAKVLRIWEEALQREAAQRQAYLEEACRDDPNLRREVEALLAEPPIGEEFLRTPPWVAPSALAAGQRLGPYEVTGTIGAGGMGEVYEACDTRLERPVAIKILPRDSSADPDRRARFEREAKAVASLNHPHICTLHDVGEHDGQMFLVMERLAGETLAERLRKGPLPLGQVLAVATDIADGLAAAHRQGLIHRDLKPGNVMLTKSGAKLLDFGLAKLSGRGEQPAAARLVSAPPGQAPALTGQNVIVGTVEYMAPEQLLAKPADARTDVWAFGAIVYEMVTGKRAFEGTSVVGLMGAILEREPPPITSLQPMTPPALERLVKRCLAKGPDERWDSAHDVAHELRWIAQSGEEAAVTHAKPQRRRRWLRFALLVAGGLAIAAVGAGVMWRLRPLAPHTPVALVSLDVRPAEELNAGGVRGSTPTPGGSRTAMAWTPDGQALVFVGKRGGVQQLYVRRLDTAEARPLAGTEGAQVPAVSADGQWVVFWAARAIKKVPLRGGPVVDLASGIGDPAGIVCDDRGAVYLGGDHGGILRIPPGEAVAAITTVGEGQVGHVLPWPLPGGGVVLYTVRKRVRSWGDEEIVALTPATGAQKVLLKDAADARYLPSGHLLFLRRGVLFAVPFDARSLEIRGAEVPILDSVAQALTATISGDLIGAGQFAVAPTGTLAWVSSPIAALPEGTPVTVDRGGRVVPLPAPPRRYGPTVRVSPDGRRLAMTVPTLTAVGLSVYDLDRGTLAPVVKEGEAGVMAWSPDGGRLGFAWLSKGRFSLATVLADGTAQPAALAAGNLDPSGWTPDGLRLTAVRNNEDIVSVVVEEGEAQRLIQTTDVETSPELSPDGRWLAYASNVSGRQELYVRPYPGPGQAEQVSLDGGSSAAWHPGGRELFFVGGPDSAGQMSLMSVDVLPGSPAPADSVHGGVSPVGGSRLGRPRPLFPISAGLAFASIPVRSYDVARDGRHFYAMQYRYPPPGPPVTHISLILNWFEELNAKVPPRR